MAPPVIYVKRANPLAQNFETGSSSESSGSSSSDPSDCGSGISGDDVADNTLIGLHPGDDVFEMIKNKLVSSLSSNGISSQVVNISRKDYSRCIMDQVKYKSFSLYSRGMIAKRNGDANVKYAWFGAAKNVLNDVLVRGFSLPPDSGLYGSGLYLAPVDRPDQSLQCAVPDENGVRHMLLCRVILGNLEVIRPGSAQYKPSSEEFDSGVDSVMYPNKYIVWNGDMNTRILPEFIVGFRPSIPCKGCGQIKTPRRVPKSDWMPFTSLVKDLSKLLPRDAVQLIAKYHGEYRKQKITRNEMIERVREIAGDKLLITIIKSCGRKGLLVTESQKSS